ncbi:MAG: hypothetical protein GDA43_04020 [Hormoscilla sp. SP5CHS1]|nr:hypothetical protein [Hormoscilla sp. SP12CHS1]MBC6452459.1 hypothetical protein [Hormoscilla sp. SP5CHS1]
MDWQAVLNSIDDLVFQQTGKHLDSLQMEILKGYLNGQKYEEIAETYKCSTGNAKDKGYEILQLLSDILGENLNKYNFRAVVERLGFANSQDRIIGKLQIGNLHISPNPETAKLENRDATNTQSNPEKTRDTNATVENVLHATKLNTVSKLTKLRLTAEQIAEAVDLPLHEVLEEMK